MKEFLVVLLALIVTVPYMLTVFLFLLLKFSGKTSVKSFRVAADMTVPILFLSVVVLLQMIFEIRMDIVLTMSVLAIAIVYAVIERLRSKEFRVKFMFRNWWRMLFILFTALYIFLLLGGLLKTVFEFLNG